MNFAQFLTTWNGKENNNGSYPGQCVDIVKQYYQDVLGLEPFIGNARDYSKETRLQKVASPMPGDLVIFDYGQYGHIGICVWSRQQDFECFEQNNPLGSPCHYVYHTDFNKILDILRPNLPENSEPRPQPKAEVKEVTVPLVAVNVNPDLISQALQLLKDYSGGFINLSITSVNIPPIESPTEVMTQDQQHEVISNVIDPSNFDIELYWICYNSTSRYVNAVTSEIPGTTTVCSAFNPGITPLNLVFELSHALIKRLSINGMAISDTDIYTPDKNFVRAKIQLVVDKIRTGGGIV